MDIKKIYLIVFCVLSMLSAVDSYAWSWPWSKQKQGAIVSTVPVFSACDRLKAALHAQKVVRNSWEGAYDDQNVTGAYFESQNKQITMLTTALSGGMVLQNNLRSYLRANKKSWLSGFCPKILPAVVAPTVIAFLPSFLSAFHTIRGAHLRYKAAMNKAHGNEQYKRAYSEYQARLKELEALQRDDIVCDPQNRGMFYDLVRKDEKLDRAQKIKNIFGFSMGHRWKHRYGDVNLQQLQNRLLGKENTDAQAERLFDVAGLL